MNLVSEPSSASSSATTLLTAAASTNSTNQYSHMRLKSRDYNGFVGQFPSLHYLIRENSTYSHSSFDNNSNEIFLNIRSDICSLRKSLSLILKEICSITARVKASEEYENKELCWKFAAQVIDRLCMVVFAFLTILSTVFILFTSKNFFKNSDPGYCLFCFVLFYHKQLQNLSSTLNHNF